MDGKTVTRRVLVIVAELALIALTLGMIVAMWLPPYLLTSPLIDPADLRQGEMRAMFPSGK
jgi:hypothetical protein